ncbi:MAG: manganese catalase family protein [Bryobacteraceae bacterium]|nr:manganese catalase family protein [Bryobacteraceae bacterium]
MFHHVKELQFNARVSEPDPRFARLLLEQFGGANGELKAALQYFVQAFPVRQTHPETYDLLMDIATEEFSHLEIVGATIQMLLGSLNGELKQLDIAGQGAIESLVKAGKMKDQLLDMALANPQFMVLSGGSPRWTDSMGNPFSGAYVNGNGDPTVDLRSNIAAESRAKIVYEYLMQFTDDPHVKETMGFLMTREIAHFQMFSAALAQIEPNFPPGVHQGDPRYTHLYFNLSQGEDAIGPWNEGQGPWPAGEQWVRVDDPQRYVEQTDGLLGQPVVGGEKEPGVIEQMNRELSDLRSTEITSKVPTGENQWSTYVEKPRTKRR